MIAYCFAKVLIRWFSTFYMMYLNIDNCSVKEREINEQIKDNKFYKHTYYDHILIRFHSIYISMYIGSPPSSAMTMKLYWNSPLCSLKSWKTLNFQRMNIITIVVNFIISLNLSAVINIMQPQFLFLLITYLWRKKKKMPCGLILYIIKLFDHLLGQIWFCLIEQFAGAFLIRSPFNVSHV